MATTATHAHTSTENQSMSYRFALPQQLRTAVDKAAADWQSNNKVDRFWKKDPTLWTQDGEEKWLGWIDIVEREQKRSSDPRSPGQGCALGWFRVRPPSRHGRLQPLP